MSELNHLKNTHTSFNGTDGKGRNNPRYIDGRSNVKNNAKTRDDYTCQICGLRDPEIMEVDHVLPKGRFPELKYDINNLMTICPNCHRRKSNREKKQYNFIKVNRK